MAIHNRQSGVRGYGRLALAVGFSFLSVPIGCVSSNTGEYNTKAVDKADEVLQASFTNGTPITVTQVKQAFLTDGIKPSDRLMASLLIADSVLNQGKLPPQAFIEGLNQAIDHQLERLPNFIRDEIDGPIEKNSSCFFNQDVITVEQWGEYQQIVATQLDLSSPNFTNDSFDSKRLKILHDISYLVAKAATVTLASDLPVTLKLLPKILEFGRDYSTDEAQIIFFLAEGPERSASRVMEPGQDLGLTRNQYIAFGLSSTIMGSIDWRNEKKDIEFWKYYIPTSLFKADFSIPTFPPNEVWSSEFKGDETGKKIVFTSPANPEKIRILETDWVRDGVSDLTFATQALHRASRELGPYLANVFEERGRETIPGYQFLSGYTVPSPPEPSMLQPEQNEPSAASKPTLLDSAIQVWKAFTGKKENSK